MQQASNINVSFIMAMGDWINSDYLINQVSAS